MVSRRFRPSLKLSYRGAHRKKLLEVFYAEPQSIEATRAISSPPILLRFLLLGVSRVLFGQLEQSVARKCSEPGSLVPLDELEPLLRICNHFAVPSPRMRQRLSRDFLSGSLKRRWTMLSSMALFDPYDQ